MSLSQEPWSILTPSRRRGVSFMMALATAGGLASAAPFFALRGDATLTGRNSTLMATLARLRGGYTDARVANSRRFRRLAAVG
jgi:hypothetical protein